MLGAPGTSSLQMETADDCSEGRFTAADGLQVVRKQHSHFTSRARMASLQDRSRTQKPATHPQHVVELLSITTEGHFINQALQIVQLLAIHALPIL